MRQTRTLALLAVLLSSIFSILASEIPNAAANNNLPSISDLEKLSFMPANGDFASIRFYTDVSEARRLFLAYGAGLDAVSKYRDPVPTRGSSGIAIFKSVAPAVVVVVVGSMKNDEFDPEGLGTGAIVDARGYVLTNWHVIQNHATAIVALKPTGSADLASAKISVARVIYQDPTVDLALLRMIDPPSPLHVIAVGDIARVQVAEDIHVIGHPHGNYWSYSTGVVSQIRDDYKWSYTDGSKHEAKVLQLQTAINPGNSGGPVVDDTGNILGLVAMSEEGQNLDYAIAADVIRRFLSTGMQMTTRGMTTPKSDSNPPQQLFAAKLADSRSVTKAVYADVVLYGISAKDAGLVAKFSDGTEIRAWDQSPNGKFRSWSAKLPQGRELMATASAGTVTHISVKQ